MSKIQFKNNTKSFVWVAIWWSHLDSAYHWKKVAAGKSTNFGKDTEYADGWSMEIRDNKNYTLSQCRSLRHNAVVTLSNTGGSGYCSKYSVSVDRPSHKGMGNIDHVVVVMLENRSFDNILGWLYNEDNPAPYKKPQRNIPNQKVPTFDGASTKNWNQDSKGNKIFVKRGTKGKSCYTVPDPDPQELFDNMSLQLFDTKAPKKNQTATMKGFVKNYETVKKNKNPDKIMESFTPEQVPILSALARNYAVCDRWFASVPCQTWPNRAFVHAGTSCGRVNNCDHNHDDCVPLPFYYNTSTIFNTLQNLKISWKVFNDTVATPSLARAQFIQNLGNPFLDGHFKSFADFKKDAKSGNLPYYSFVEPCMLLPPQNDMHPPHDVRLGEQFIHEVWTAVKTGRDWENTLLIFTYDEHGGCYDHVSPPWTAVKPDNSKPQQRDFGFNRYGVRVPAVVVSPFIEPGTVFRSGSDKVEYDHTSILATLRDWLQIPASKMPQSKRIKTAPTLDQVLTRTTPRTDTPVIKKPRKVSAKKADELPLNSMQKSLLAAAVLQNTGRSKLADQRTMKEVLEAVKTPSDAAAFLQIDEPD